MIIQNDISIVPRRRSNYHCEKVLTEVYKLPPEKQDTIAAVILEELEDERLWDKAFADSTRKHIFSQDKLAQLARKVRADIKADRIKKMGIDEL